MTVGGVSGFDVEPLTSSECEQYLSWLLGECSCQPDGAPGLVWALAHCDDGVTWGYHDMTTKTWRLGNQAAPEISPPIRANTLQELRLFGEAGEVLIWRTDMGLCGRVLLESTTATDRSDESNPLRPSDEPRILRGDHEVARLEHAFTRIADRSGAEQVIPIAASGEQLRNGDIRLCVRHYYESDATTGATRIAATRLVTFTSRGSDGT